MSETETRFFDDMVQQEVTIALMDDMLAAIRDLAQQSGMSEDEAIRFVLATGLAYLEGEKALQSACESDCAQALERVSKQMLDCYAQYSVMKFKAFSLLQVARTLEINVAGLRLTEQGLRGVIERLREENEQLQAENKRLKREA